MFLAWLVFLNHPSNWPEWHHGMRLPLRFKWPIINYVDRILRIFTPPPLRPLVDKSTTQYPSLCSNIDIWLTPSPLYVKRILWITSYWHICLKFPILLQKKKTQGGSIIDTGRQRGYKFLKSVHRCFQFWKLDINVKLAFKSFLKHLIFFFDNLEKYTKSCLDFRNDTWLRYSNSTILMSLERVYCMGEREGIQD